MKTNEVQPSTIDLAKLSEPMTDIKWRVQSVKEYNNSIKVICIPYVDSRDVQKRLDDVCGVANWQSRFKEVKGNLFCEIGILINGTWIWKSDVGTESNIEKAKGESSDSFKRASVMWGIGRELYAMQPMKIDGVKVKGKNYPSFVKNGERKAIYDGSILSQYCNHLLTSKRAA